MVCHISIDDVHGIRGCHAQIALSSKKLWPFWKFKVMPAVLIFVIILPKHAYPLLFLVKPFIQICVNLQLLLSELIVKLAHTLRHTILFENIS